jgi:hypothetical protein
LNNILIFAPKQDPDIEWNLETPERTDNFIKFFVDHGYFDEEEVKSLPLEAKRKWIRWYIQDLKMRKRETIKKLSGLEHMGKEGPGGSQSSESGDKPDPGTGSKPVLKAPSEGQE